MFSTTKSRIEINKTKNNQFIGTLYAKNGKTINTPKLNSKSETLLAFTQMAEYQAKPQYLTLQ